ncbi:N-methyl-D-aspartate receptor NMDAR2C subunit [Variovorax sp. NFACC27]|uniref:HD domain-containing protein n=1 Tax=unclassified Variovorax TaxID=663243 RepID=UPI000895EB2D|nr:Predicted metal-dependent phosphohydrolase, HD superfamily [Variovorax sp. NFACC28]SEG79883.1 Predicted metal-dependent phosphohydrolase, HD superfamily [Variovorax sp. NFACC29]SFC91437.1 Predicted metal-dependent phosphohydrolase, HD superfamily [Variovorax sp. NFACC26]SFG05756.1 Predicted metal-dependent phosphohydrolase, HD superfamily [Variovorax sp. NFACC27]
MTPEALHANWAAAWHALGVASPGDALCDELQRRYTEPQRHYHTMQHLGECLAWFEREKALAERPGEVALALWFHDAIYDVHAHDNEARSADWARRALLDADVDTAAADRVHALVMATRHDAVPQGRDAELLIDIDLSILGAERARFDEYERQVQAEYAFVPDEVRLPRRRAILQRFLDRKAIYATPRIHAQLEARARANLQRSISG